MAESNSETTGSRVKKGLDDIAECSVCLATFVDPRVLPCVHTFCKECLIKTHRQQSGAQQHGADTMHCPICRNFFPVPEDGFDGLPKNFFMERIVEITRTLDDSSSSSQTPCSVCSEDGGQTVATTFCVDCQMNLCERCRQHHQRSRLTSEHRLMDGARGGQRSAEEAQGSRALTCLEHEDEGLRLYCYACEELVCPMCYILHHKDHKWMRVDAAAKTFKAQIETQVEAMTTCVEETSAAKRLLQDEREKTEKRSKELEEKVLRVGDSLKELIDRHVEQILQRLQEEKHRRTKDLLTGNDDTERHLVSLQSYRSYCTSILENGRDDEICRMAKELLSRASELKKQNEDIKQRELKHNDLQSIYRPTHNDVQSINRLEDIYLSTNLIINFTEALENCELEENKAANEDAEHGAEAAETPSGKAQVSHQPENPTADVCVKTDAVQSKPTAEESSASGFDLQTPRLIGALSALKTGPSSPDGRPPIWGIARLNDELFVINGLNVEVHDATRCTYKRQWETMKMMGEGGPRNLQDIVACETHKCLYVVDYRLRKILQYNSSGRLISNWSVEGIGRLSLTPQSTVLFTSYGYNRLIEYDSVGKSLRTVNLGTIKAPVHAVKLESGHYVITMHGENDGQKISIVDENGKVTKVYSKSRDVHLGSPIHVIASRVEGCFLVADWVSGVIVVLDSDLKYKRTLLGSKNGLRRPARMCLDENSRRLYVASNFNGFTDGRVLIFDI